MGLGWWDFWRFFLLLQNVRAVFRSGRFVFFGDFAHKNSRPILGRRVFTIFDCCDIIVCERKKSRFGATTRRSAVVLSFTKSKREMFLSLFFIKRKEGCLCTLHGKLCLLLSWWLPPSLRLCITFAKRNNRLSHHASGYSLAIWVGATVEGFFRSFILLRFLPKSQ